MRDSHAHIVSAYVAQQAPAKPVPNRVVSRLIVYRSIQLRAMTIPVGGEVIRVVGTIRQPEHVIYIYIIRLSRWKLTARRVLALCGSQLTLYFVESVSKLIVPS